MSSERAAAIGVGVLGFAHGHVGSYCAAWNKDASLGVRVLAGWDHDAARAGKARESFGIELASSQSDLLGRADVQAVVIAAETSMHADLVEQAAAAGKAIILQKPIALTMDQADRIVGAVARTGVPVHHGLADAGRSAERADEGADSRRRARQAVHGPQAARVGHAHLGGLRELLARRPAVQSRHLGGRRLAPHRSGLLDAGQARQRDRRARLAAEPHGFPTTTAWPSSATRTGRSPRCAARSPAWPARTPPRSSRRTAW